MPLLGFKAEFAEPVASGAKRQTVRARRKDGRDPKVGDRLYLWTGLRQPGARKLGEATVGRVLAIVIHPEGYEARTIGGTSIGLSTRTQFAKRDGFESWPAMRDWFRANHGLPFRGLLIEWGKLEEVAKR